MNRKKLSLFLLLWIFCIHITMFTRPVQRGGPSSSGSTTVSLGDLPTPQKARTILTALEKKSKIITAEDVDDFYNATISLRLSNDPFLKTEEYEKLKKLILSAYPHISEPTVIPTTQPTQPSANPDIPLPPAAPGFPPLPPLPPSETPQEPGEEIPTPPLDPNAPPPPPIPGLPPFGVPGIPPVPKKPTTRAPLTEEEINKLTQEEKNQSDQELINYLKNFSSFQLIKFESYKSILEDEFKKLWNNKQFKPRGGTQAELLTRIRNFIKDNLTAHDDSFFTNLLQDFETKKMVVAAMVKLFSSLAYDAHEFEISITAYIEELILCIATAQRTQARSSTFEQAKSDELLTNALKSSPSIEELEKKVSLFRINLIYKLPHTLRAEKEKPTDQIKQTLGAPQIPLLDFLRNTDTSLVKVGNFLTSLRLSLFFGQEFVEETQADSKQSELITLLITKRITSIHKLKELSSQQQIIKLLTEQVQKLKTMPQLRALANYLQENVKVNEYIDAVQELNNELKVENPNTAVIIPLLGAFFITGELPKTLSNIIENIIKTYIETTGRDNRFLKVFDETYTEFEAQLAKVTDKKTIKDQLESLTLESIIQIDGLFLLYKKLSETLTKEGIPPSKEIKELFNALRSTELTPDTVQTAYKNILISSDAKTAISTDANKVRFRRLIFSYGTLVKILKIVQEQTEKLKRNSTTEWISVLTGLTKTVTYLNTGILLAPNAKPPQYFKAETEVEKALHLFVSSLLSADLQKIQFIKKLSTIVSLCDDQNYIGALNTLNHLIEKTSLNTTKAPLLPFENETAFNSNWDNYAQTITYLKNSFIYAELTNIKQELTTFNQGESEIFQTVAKQRTISGAMQAAVANQKTNTDLINQLRALLDEIASFLQDLNRSKKTVFEITQFVNQASNELSTLSKNLTTLFLSKTSSWGTAETNAGINAFNIFINSQKKCLQYLIAQK